VNTHSNFSASCRDQKQPTLESLFDMPFAERIKAMDAMTEDSAGAAGDLEREETVVEETSIEETSVEPPAEAPKSSATSGGASNWGEADVIDKINKALHMADFHAEKTKSSRLEAGKLLIEASQHVPAGEWGRWCKANVKRSERDIRKVMKLAGAADPSAAVEDERKRNRQDKKGQHCPAGHSDRKVNTPDLSSPPPPPASDTAEIKRLKAELEKAQAEIAKWREDAQQLVNNFHERTEEWLTLRKEKEALEGIIAELRGEKGRTHIVADWSFSKDEWAVLVKCLHPDGSPSAELKTRAMQLLNVRKDVLRSVEEEASQAEMEAKASYEAMKAKAEARVRRRKAA
jgi:Protein of unknown function (DUF3102)